MRCRVQTECLERLDADPERCTDDDGIRVDALTVDQLDRGNVAVATGDQPLHGRVDDGDTGGAQRVEPGVVRLDAAVQHQRELRGELAEQAGRVQAHRVSDDLHDALVADLVAVAERAVDDVATPVLGDTLDVGQHVDQARRRQHPAGDHAAAADQLDTEASIDEPGHVDRATVEDLDAVAANLLAPDRGQLCRRQPLMAEVAVHVRRRGVARLTSVDDDHRAALPAELQSCSKTGG